MKRHVLKKYKSADLAPPLPKLPAREPAETPGKRFERWLESFGQWLGNHGLKTELADFAGISKQSVTRYFVARSHELPARVFLKALEFQERKRARAADRWYWRYPVPALEFLSWTFSAEPAGQPSARAG